MYRSIQLLELLVTIIHIKLFDRTNQEIKIRREINRSFRQLGGVYIKFLQALIINTDFLRGWGGPAELSVFESLPYEPLDPKKVIIDELGQASLDRFSSIEKTPFATGSFAQVYKATLTDGSPVIVKILRPRLIKTLKKDLRVLGYLMKLVSVFKNSNLFDAKSLFNNFAEMTISEVDYIREVKNAKWFWNYYKDDLSIIVPWTYEELSGSGVLTQDYIGGISLNELVTAEDSGRDPAAICRERTGSDFWYLMEVLGQDFVHSTVWSDYMFGDPHPGNIKFLPNDQIGLIDFGLVVETGVNKRAYVDLLEAYNELYDGHFDPGHFMMAFITFFDENLAKSLRQFEEYKAKQPGWMMSQISQSAALNYMNQMGKGVGAEAVDRKRIVDLFVNAINDGNRYGLKMDPQSAGMMKSAGAYIFLLRKFSHGSEEQDIMSKIIGAEVDYAKANRDRLPQTTAVKNVSLEDAIEILGDWLLQVADKDPGLYYNLSRSLSNGYA